MANLKQTCDLPSYILLIKQQMKETPMNVKRSPFYDFSLTVTAIVCSFYMVGCAQSERQTVQTVEPAPRVSYINNEKFMSLYNKVGMTETMHSTTFIGVAGDYALLKVWEKGVMFSDTTTLFITDVSKLTDEQKEAIAHK